MRRWLSRRLYDASFMESPSVQWRQRAGRGRREQVTVVLVQRRCHSLTPTTARRPRRHAAIASARSRPWTRVDPVRDYWQRAVCSAVGGWCRGGAISLTATTARSQRRLHGGAPAVDAPGPTGFLAAAYSVPGSGAFEGAVGGLVDASCGVDHRPHDPGPQEPVDGLQPARLPALRLPFPAQHLGIGSDHRSSSHRRSPSRMIPALGTESPTRCSETPILSE